MNRPRVGLIFGGRSVEHEVSVTSATSILGALDRDRWDVQLVGVDLEGQWRLGEPGDQPGEALDRQRVYLPAFHGSRSLLASEGPDAGQPRAELDLVFPIIHGTGGEDGSLQGLLDLTGIPYVGSGVLGSAVAMDKDLAKKLLAAEGIPVVPWHLVRASELEQKGEAMAEAAIAGLGLPLFVKPACLGSSVGIAKVERADDLLPALREAARYDEKILIERGVDAREIEVAVLGGDETEISVAGEIVPKASFYDYESKYEDDATELVIPAALEDSLAERIRNLARCSFRGLELWGLARIDFFLDRQSGELLLNEVNTLPGFTKVSMYPLLWEASGLRYPDLLDRLLELAQERSRRREKLIVQRPR